jgi:hypothetical protein
MSERLTVQQLEAMGQQLKVYDVDQGGWEHEIMDYEFNANHVLKHLVRDHNRKDFFDEGTVVDEIAPDSVQYALRLSRWVQFDHSQLSPNTYIFHDVARFSGHNRYSSNRMGAHYLAESDLADFLHELDHKDKREEAHSFRVDTLSRIGKLLIHSAELAAVEFGFDLVDSFGRRLSNLRQRFGIPEPVKQGVES